MLIREVRWNCLYAPRPGIYCQRVAHMHPTYPSAGGHVVVMLVLLVGACSDPALPTVIPKSVHDPKVTRIVFEVDYAAGAEPYVGPTLLGPLWGLFTANAKVLLNQREVIAPTTLAEMEALTDVTGDDFTVQNIVDIATRHRDQAPAGDTFTFYLLWLPGYFYYDGQRQDTVLALSIGNTGIIAVFKPPIRAESEGSSILAVRFLEQTVVVHELGHAVGLVNNGLPLTSAHQDTEAGAHCSNSHCVMYWQANRAGTALREFVQDYVESSNSILFAQDCLDDILAGKAR